VPLFSFEGKTSNVHPDAWIAPTATPETEVPGETVAYGSPAKKFAPLTGAPKLWVEHNPRISRGGTGTAPNQPRATCTARSW
jgi:hypothetical protein